jgi:hypothetical protein
MEPVKAEPGGGMKVVLCLSPNAIPECQAVPECRAPNAAG